MSAPKVDVRAVLDNAAERLGSTVYAPELREASAAVAELIEAANASLQASPSGAQVSANLRLMDALDRIGGAA